MNDVLSYFGEVEMKPVSEKPEIKHDQHIVCCTFYIHYQKVETSLVREWSGLTLSLYKCFNGQIISFMLTLEPCVYVKIPPPA